MAWTVPRTWTAGLVVTAAMMNTDVRDNINFISTFLSTGTLTANGLLYGSGTAPIGVTPALTSGVIVIGGAGTPGTLGAFTGPTGVLKSTYGGLGADLSTGTKGAVLAASSTGVYNALVAGADGQLLEANATSSLGMRWVAAGALSFLRHSTGTFTSTATGTNLDTISITGLATGDVLYVTYGMVQASGTGAALDLSGSSTSNRIARLGTALGANLARSGHSEIMLDPLSTGAVWGFALGAETEGGTSSGTTIYRWAQNAGIGTAWAGTWDLILNTGALATVGTLVWAWTVWRMKS